MILLHFWTLDMRIFFVFTRLRRRPVHDAEGECLDMSIPIVIPTPWRTGWVVRNHLAQVACVSLWVNKTDNEEVVYIYIIPQTYGWSR